MVISLKESDANQHSDEPSFSSLFRAENTNAVHGMFYCLHSSLL
jgi:hypothetical protein